MTVREFDDLFYVCSLLESVSRSTKNHRGFVAELKEKLERAFAETADTFFIE